MKREYQECKPFLDTSLSNKIISGALYTSIVRQLRMPGALPLLCWHVSLHGGHVDQGKI